MRFCTRSNKNVQVWHLHLQSTYNPCAAWPFIVSKPLISQQPSQRRSQICNFSVYHQVILWFLPSLPCTAVHTAPLNDGSLNFHNREKCQALTQYIFPCNSYSGKYTHWEIRFGRSFNSPPGDLQLCDCDVFSFIYLFISAQNKQFTSNAPSVLQIWPFPLTSRCFKAGKWIKKKKTISPTNQRACKGRITISSLTFDCSETLHCYCE